MSRRRILVIVGVLVILAVVGIVAYRHFMAPTRILVVNALKAQQADIVLSNDHPQIKVDCVEAEEMGSLAGYDAVIIYARRLFLTPEQEAEVKRVAEKGVPVYTKTLRSNDFVENHNLSKEQIATLQEYFDNDSNPSLIRITNLDGKSYSNTVQVDATYPIVKGLELTAAWRWNDVKCTYGGKLMEKPLTSKYKGLITASYKTPLGLWQVDATLQLNGGGRMPTPVNGLWDERFQAYEQVSAQITRWFRHFSVYIGGENLTGFRQKQTIINAADPWSSSFDPTMVWGPVHGAMFYAGVRVNFGRL